MEKEEDKLVSIIIPAYNVENYIPTCLESIKAQTYKNIEVIIIDDGSTDGTGRICEEFAKEDSRVKVIHKKNGGLSSARNTGLENVNGDYIVFLDSDDYVNFRYIERLVNVIKSSKTDIAICDFETLSSMDESLIYKEEKEKEYLIIKGNEKFHALYNNSDKARMVVAWGKIYKKEIFDEIRYPVGENYEDAAIVSKILYKADKIALFDEKLCYYLKRNGSITQRISIDVMLNLQNYKDRQVFFEKNVNDSELLQKNAIVICELIINIYKKIGLLDLQNKKELYISLYNDYKYYYQKYINLKKIPKLQRLNLFLFYKFKKIYNYIIVSLTKMYRILNKKNVVPIEK